MSVTSAIVFMCGMRSNRRNADLKALDNSASMVGNEEPIDMNRNRPSRQKGST
jgi:hypothetical protein